MSIRPVKRLIKSKPTLEGAGVHLRRAFGFGNTKDFDPFLLLDDTYGRMALDRRFVDSKRRQSTLDEAALERVSAVSDFACTAMW
jgi:redox-sensitive bicupin YhaK (pirin superfamily)